MTIRLQSRKVPQHRWFMFLLGLHGCAVNRLVVHTQRLERYASQRATIQVRTVDHQLRVIASARLDGRPSDWQLDTGATGHSLTVGSARRLGLFDTSEPTSSPILLWHGDVASTRLTRPVSLEVFPGLATSPQRLPIHEDDSIDFREFTGVLSPYAFLSSDTAVAINFHAGFLYQLRASLAEQEQQDMRTLGGSQLTLCGVLPDHHLPIVNTVINGQPVRLLVDTGSPTSLLFASTTAGQRASLRASHHITLHADTFPTDIAVVPGIRFEYAGISRTIRMVVISQRASISSALCGAEGVMGVDVLRACSLVIGQNTGTILCTVPTTELDPAVTITQTPPTPIPAPLPSPETLAVNIIARIGCTALSPQGEQQWWQENERGFSAISLPQAMRQPYYIRTQLVENLAADYEIQVTETQLVEQLAGIARQNGIALEALPELLQTTHTTLPDYRRFVRYQLLEQMVAQYFQYRDEQQFTAFLSRVRDRYRRVRLERENHSCQPAWPWYFLDQVRFIGLSPEQDDSFRTALASALRGHRFTLGPSGEIPRSMIEITQRHFSQYSQVRLQVEEESTQLRIRVVHN